jgi:hypothetical protein
MRRTNVFVTNEEIQELKKQAAVGDAIREAMASHGRLHTNQATDEGAMAMQAHRFGPPSLHAELERGQRRATEYAARTRAVSALFVNAGTDAVALAMEPPSLVAHIRQVRS